MANLSFIQKQLIESVFDMGSGYFLDLNNREFEEYMKDVVNYSISNKYPGLSKARMFRAFYNEEEDRFVGKAIVIAINYGVCVKLQAEKRVLLFNGSNCRLEIWGQTPRDMDV